MLQIRNSFPDNAEGLWSFYSMTMLPDQRCQLLQIQGTGNVHKIGLRPKFSQVTSAKRIHNESCQSALKGFYHLPIVDIMRKMEPLETTNELVQMITDKSLEKTCRNWEPICCSSESSSELKCPSYFRCPGGTLEQPVPALADWSSQFPKTTLAVSNAGE